MAKPFFFRGHFFISRIRRPCPTEKVHNNSHRENPQVRISRSGGDCTNEGQQGEVELSWRATTETTNFPDPRRNREQQLWARGCQEGGGQEDRALHKGANVRGITPYSAAWGALFRSRPCRAKTHHPPCEEYSHLHNVWANLQI